MGNYVHSYVRYKKKKKTLLLLVSWLRWGFADRHMILQAFNMVGGATQSRVRDMPSASHSLINPGTCLIYRLRLEST
ncbi:hypothetical protein GGR50DRAFT_655421 [Xylaria sp. CBS 124048]|nr:hypothetical protein GGR50DRAFT_655421 [Xylaria sp. CBS 124048]